MTTNPYTLQSSVLRHIPMLSYKKVNGFAAYGLSFLPTEQIYHQYTKLTHKTGMKDYPFVVILDETEPQEVITALGHTTRPSVHKELGTQGNTVPTWLATARQWLSAHNIPFTEFPPTAETTNIIALKPDYIPQCYSNNISKYGELHINRNSVNELTLVNVPYKKTETEYIIFVHKQATTIVQKRSTMEREQKIYMCCEYKLHVHRRDLLHSITTTFKPEHTTEDKWLSINELLMKEEQWLTDHASWNNEALYNSFGGK